MFLLLISVNLWHRRYNPWNYGAHNHYRNACCTGCNRSMIITDILLDVTSPAFGCKSWPIDWHLTETQSRLVGFSVLQYFNCDECFVTNIATPFEPRIRFRGWDGRWARSESARKVGSAASPDRRCRPSLAWRLAGLALCAPMLLPTPSWDGLLSPQSLRR